VPPRIRFHQGLGEEPRAEPARVDFWFIDANHDQVSTEAAFHR